MAQLKLMKDFFPEQHLYVMRCTRPETSFLKNYRILGADSMIGKKESNFLTGNDQPESTQIWWQHLTVKCTDISSMLLIYHQSVICGILFIASSMRNWFFVDSIFKCFGLLQNFKEDHTDSRRFPGFPGVVDTLVWIQFLGEHFWFGF